MTEPTHTMRTVEDFLAVPPEKIEACLKDFGMWLAMHHFAKSLSDLGVKSDPSAFKWIADGKHDMHLNMVVRMGEEPTP